MFRLNKICLERQLGESRLENTFACDGIDKIAMVSAILRDTLNEITRYGNSVQRELRNGDSDDFEADLIDSGSLVISTSFR